MKYLEKYDFLFPNRNLILTIFCKVRYTACVFEMGNPPDGIKKVYPCLSSTLWHPSARSPRKMSLCLPDSTQSSYRARLWSVGGTNQNTWGSIDGNNIPKLYDLLSWVTWLKFCTIENTFYLSINSFILSILQDYSKRRWLFI